MMYSSHDAGHVAQAKRIRDGVPGQYPGLESLFYEHGVDLYFAGHEHVYEVGVCGMVCVVWCGSGWYMVHGAWGWLVHGVWGWVVHGVWGWVVQGGGWIPAEGFDMLMLVLLDRSIQFL
jgi:hypothetical protein